MKNNSNSKLPMQIIIEKFLRSNKSHPYELNAYHRIIIFILASYMGNNTSCYPSLASLVNDCGISKRTIIRSNNNLENKNILIITREKEKNNIYQFTEEVVSIGHHLVSYSHQVVTDRHCHVVPNRHPNNNNINNNINNKKNFFLQKSKDEMQREKENSKKYAEFKRTQMPEELRQKLKRF